MAKAARILDRYLFRETLETWAGVTGVLLLILLASRFAFYLGDAAAGRLPGSAVFTLLGLSVVTYLTLIIPLGLFLAVMLAFGRLYRDSEMAALMACGVGIRDLYRPLLRLAGLLAAVLLVLALFVGPWAAEKSFLVRKHAEHEAEVAVFESGRFKSTRDGSAVYYAEHVDQQTLALDKVFVQRIDRVPAKGLDAAGKPATTERISVITARSGRQETDPATGTRRLVLRDGRRYTGVPGEPTFSVIEFAEHGVVIDVADPNLVSDDRKLRPTNDLIAEGSPKALAELNWRIGVAISALVFALLALPLSRANPREGRFARLFAAILLWIIYSNLLGVVRLWLDREKLPPEVGLWPVHLLFVAIALALLVRQNGWRTLFDDLAGQRLRPAAHDA
jgi:lipopolysaccharide export system permease protein